MQNTMMSGKPFLTYDQQIDKLEKEKGLIIIDKDSALKLLKEHSYFALISGYKQPFKDGDGTYKKNTKIEDILILYNFDDQLRSIILRYILMVEKHIKSLIAYSFCEVYGEKQNCYLDTTNYNYIPLNQLGINELVNKLSSIVNDPGDCKYIYYQKRKYGNIPLWVMMKALTLGAVSKMYSYLPQTIQCKVSKEFDFVNESELLRMLDLLSRIRNVCAHNERLYDYKYNKGAINDTYTHDYLNIRKKGGQYVYGKSDLFAVLITLKHLLTELRFQKMIDDVNECLNSLFRDTRQVQRFQIYKYMGFPENWYDLKTSQLAEIKDV
ncbi:MAG: Abi family protein [Herbinix sp.]|nr:Abi family protein [Herbinix sp.]